MKKLVLILILVISTIASESYKLDNKNSNSYFKAVSDVLFFGSDEIIGINKDLSGNLLVNHNNISGVISINSGKFNTQNDTRDTHIKQILNYNKYPNIKFEIFNEIENNNKIFLIGNLFINGVKKTIRNKQIIYRGKTSIKYKDFNITPPTLAGIIKQAKDSIEIGAKIVFTKEQ